MNDLLKLLDERDADGEKQPAFAGYSSGDPTTTPSVVTQGGGGSAFRVFRTYWSDPVPPLALDNTRTKTEQARSVTGYMEVTATTLVDGAPIYDTPLGGQQLTRIY